MQRSKPDRDKLVANWPTDRHPPEFWEQLGRTVATYGFLEEVLGKAIFAYTGTRRYDSEADARAAYAAWLPKLERALSDTLKPLIDAYLKAVRDNAQNKTENIDELVEALRKVADIRNVLCHGSWRPPDDKGFSVPFFMNKRLEFFETPIDIAYLREIQAHVTQLACSVIDSVTLMGFQFPGGGGSGMPIWPRK